MTNGQSKLKAEVEKNKLQKVQADKARAAELGLTLTEYYLFLLVEYKYLNRI